MGASVSPIAPVAVGPLPIPRLRSRWKVVRVLAGGVAIVALLLAGASFFVDEPLRGYMERALNAELQGYTVRLAALAFHPLGFSITLKDLTIAQNAHPQPPVAQVPELHASVQWQALLSGRLLADFVLRQPHVRIDRMQLQHEASDKVSLKDEGWQQALEAIYPLKINHFRIENGDLTYIDDDPKRPLHVSHLNLLADNIRNVRSADHVYPSNVHMDGAVFDSGKLRVDGHANFLAEPTTAIDADITLDQVQLDYFKPMLARINLWITDGALWADGHVEYSPQVENFHLKHLTLRTVQLDYVHSTQTAAEEKTRATTVGRAAQKLSHAPVAVFRVDELHIADSTVGYVDHSADPGYRVFVEKSDLMIKNVSNQAADGPASLELTGQFMGSGDAAVQAIVTPATPSRDLDLWVTIEGTQLQSMNNLLRTFGNFDVVAGQFTVYSQIAIKNGEISGYLKPIFTDMQVYSQQQDAGKPLLHRMYEGLVGGTQTVLQNRRGEVATTVEISGRASDPETSTWALVFGLIQNAFVKAIAHGFEPRDSDAK
jgi:uncharacterized protein DUF748